jgi:hypothetical protein
MGARRVRCQIMPDPIEPDPEIEAEIKQIQTLEALRKRW